MLLSTLVLEGARGPSPALAINCHLGLETVKANFYALVRSRSSHEVLVKI